MTAERITAQLALVLFAISEGHSYGYAIRDATGVGSGTLYPLLHRLEQRRLVTRKDELAATAFSEHRPRRRYYKLTRHGHVVLARALLKHPFIARVLNA